jgi:acetolactate synthase I/II/III large subunit
MSTPTKKPAPQTGAELLVKSLEAQGVEYIFGIPGAKIDKVFDTLVDSKIKTIVCRHEQNTAFIASGIGRMTGKAGVTWSLRGQAARIWSQVSQRRPPKAIPSWALEARCLLRID